MGALRGVRCKERSGLLRGNQFHPCMHTPEEVILAAKSLAELLAEAGAKGVKEMPLLEWFGASTARISLLAHAGRHLVPTHVARELCLGDMRADFALLQVPKQPTAAPRLLLVECQGALPKSLFEKGSRQLLYWGRDFLDGFSQLVNWHFVGHHTTLDQSISALVVDCTREIEVSFLLVVGLRTFSMDRLSQRRLLSWAQTLTIGSNFRISRFDDIADDALSWVSDCSDWADVHVGTPDDKRRARRPRTAGSEPSLPLSTSIIPRNNKAALARRPHGLTGAGAGT